MKITGYRIRYAKHYLFVEIDTDEGITGLGEAGNWTFLKPTAEAIREMCDFMIGKDPSRIEDWNQNFYRAQYFRGSVVMSAVSAIDIALWDIKGKRLGVPVYELLGGKVRDKVRCYASPMHVVDGHEALKASYQELKDQGFTAAKIFVNGPISSPDGKGEFHASRIHEEARKVALVREAVGDDFDLVLEVHRGMDKAQAIAFGREVEKYHPMVLEDPVPPDNYDTMAEVASKVAVPIATGERFISLGEFEAILSRHATCYVRPDVCATGGITTAKKVAALAEAHDVLIIPHNPLGPVSSAACLQICACTPNLAIQELPGFCLNGKEDAMVDRPIRFSQGFIEIPDAPGIGLSLSPDAEELYPAVCRGGMAARRSCDGAVKNW